MKICRKWSEEPSIFSKLQIFESIHEGFSFSVTLKGDFCNNVLVQIFSLTEYCCIEIRALLAAILQKLLPQVSFLGISLNILTILSKSSFLHVWLTSEFFSDLVHNSHLNGYMALILLSYKIVIHHLYKEVIHFSINLFIVNKNKTRMLWGQIR